MSAINSVARLVASMVYNADRNVRDELSKEFITSEDDYVSNLTSQIRNEWNRYNLPCYVHSQRLNRQQENLFGCDAVILFKIEDKAKLCLFEAKYPRIKSSNNYRWDSLQISSGISHFSDQLSRQSKWSHLAAIWELFILEESPGNRFKSFDLWGSTCIWHSRALEFDHIEKDPNDLWENCHLENLLGRAKLRTTLRQTNLFEILISVLTCKSGVQIPIQNNLIRISSSDRDAEISVPASLESMREDVEEFCEEYGVKHFWYLELDKNTKAKMK